MSILLIFPFLGAMLGSALGVLGLAIPRFRQLSLRLILSSFGYLAGAYPMIFLGTTVRREAFLQLSVRSETVVKAIEQYAKVSGKPPRTLDDLVPNFLPSIPSTGMSAYPKYRYVSGNAARTEYHGNEWVLYVSTPSGGINFDVFLYFPRQNYPDAGYGGSLERIGTWGYVHE